MSVGGLNNSVHNWNGPEWGLHEDVASKRLSEALSKFGDLSLYEHSVKFGQMYDWSGKTNRDWPNGDVYQSGPSPELSKNSYRAINDGVVQIRYQLENMDPETFEKCLLNATAEDRGIVLEVLSRYRKEDETRPARSELHFVFSSNPADNEQDLLKIIRTLEVLRQRPTKPLTFFQSILKLTPTMISLSSWFSSFKNSWSNPSRKTVPNEGDYDYLQRMTDHFPFLTNTDRRSSMTDVEKNFFDKDEMIPKPITEQNVSSEKMANNTNLPLLRDNKEIELGGKQTISDSIRNVFRTIMASFDSALIQIFRRPNSHANNSSLDANFNYLVAPEDRLTDDAGEFVDSKKTELDSGMLLRQLYAESDRNQTTLVSIRNVFRTIMSGLSEMHQRASLWFRNGYMPVAQEENNEFNGRSTAIVSSYDKISKVNGW